LRVATKSLWICVVSYIESVVGTTMSYPGLRGRTYRNKYAGCAHSKIHGGPVRLLTASEIAEFRAYVEKVMSARPAKREVR
jgi:hypothetical protein